MHKLNSETHCIKVHLEIHENNNNNNNKGASATHELSKPSNLKDTR